MAVTTSRMSEDIERRREKAAEQAAKEEEREIRLQMAAEHAAEQRRKNAAQEAREKEAHALRLEEAAHKRDEWEYKRVEREEKQKEAQEKREVKRGDSNLKQFNQALLSQMGVRNAKDKTVLPMEVEQMAGRFHDMARKDPAQAAQMVQQAITAKQQTAKQFEAIIPHMVETAKKEGRPLTAAQIDEIRSHPPEVKYQILKDYQAKYQPMEKFKTPAEEAQEAQWAKENALVKEALQKKEMEAPEPRADLAGGKARYKLDEFSNLPVRTDVTQGESRQLYADLMERKRQSEAAQPGGPNVWQKIAAFTEKYVPGAQDMGRVLIDPNTWANRAVQPAAAPAAVTGGVETTPVSTGVPQPPSRPSMSPGAVSAPVAPPEASYGSVMAGGGAGELASKTMEGISSAAQSVDTAMKGRPGWMPQTNPFQDLVSRVGQALGGAWTGMAQRQAQWQEGNTAPPAPRPATSMAALPKPGEDVVNPFTDREMF